MLSLGFALTKNEPFAVQNVYAIIGIHLEDVPGDLRQLFLLLGHRHTLEDAVITAADAIYLVIGEVSVLRYFHIVHRKVSGNAVNGGSNICLIHFYGCFRNNVAYAVTDKYLNGNAGIRFFLIGKIHQRTGDPVRHLIRVARINFLKHGVTPSSHGAGVP